MKRCLLLLPVLLLVAADPAVERAARKERAKLLGTWVALPPEYLQPDEVLKGWWPVFEIAADKINVSTIELEGKKIVRKPAGPMTFVLDPTANPKTIDLTATYGPRKGKARICIYELNGDSLKLAEALGDAARPTKFTQDRHTSILVFRRTTPEALGKAMATLEESLLKIRDGATAIALPTSRMAKPIDPQAKAKEILVDIREGSGQVFGVQGGDAPLTLADVRKYFKQQYDDATQAKREVAVVFRSAAKAHASSLYEAARAARAVGFANVYVEVMRASGGLGRLELFFPDWHRPIEDLSVHVPRRLADESGEVRGYDLGPLGSKESMLAESLDTLEKQLKEQRVKEDVPNKESVRIQPDALLNVSGVIGVIDTCLAAGFPRPTIGPLLDQPETTRTKVPAPSEKEQAGAEKEIKTIYGPHYAKPAGLALKLREGAAICDEAAPRFVFLTEAADAAARAGQLLECMDILDQLAKNFAVDPWPLKLEKFKKAPMNQAAADAALREASNSDLEKRRDYAARFMRIAEIAAKQTKDSELIQYVEERRDLLKLPNLDNTNPFAPMRSAQDNQPSAALVERMTATPVSVLSLVLWYGVPVALVGVLLTAGMIWWMRRERAVRSRLSQARGRQFELPSEDPPVGS